MEERYERFNQAPRFLQNTYRFLLFTSFAADYLGSLFSEEQDLEKTMRVTKFLLKQNVDFRQMKNLKIAFLKEDSGDMGDLELD